MQHWRRTIGASPLLTPVLGLREGYLLRMEGAQMTLRGTVRARLFRRDDAVQELTPPCNVSMLLRA